MQRRFEVGGFRIEMMQTEAGVKSFLGGVASVFGAARQAPALALASLLLGACGSLNTVVSPGEDPVTLVKSRAEARWQALIDKDLDKAYAFFSEGTRQAMSLEQYKQRTKPGMWRKVEVESAECKDAVCQVKLQITYDHKQWKGVVTPVGETWLVENGNVWYVLKM